MVKANYNDKSLIVNILVKSFDTNKSVNYVVKQDKNREKRIRALMEYSFEMCWYFGEIYINNEKNAAVLLLLPEKKKTTLKAIQLDLVLALKCIGLARVLKVLDRESQIKKHHPKNFMYLWYIGVYPDQQGKRIGSTLLNDTTELANKRSLPIYLETSTMENLPFYNKAGFEIFQELNFNYTLYLFKKEPK